MYARLASLQSGPKPQAAPHRKEARQRCCELVNACDVQARGRKSPVPFSGHAYEFQEENHESTIGPAVNRISARDREHRPPFFARQRTPWGEAIDFSAAAVRAFFRHNALYWLEEYHQIGRAHV